MDNRHESTLTYALLTQPARAALCRALLDAGEDGLPAGDLAASLGLAMPRATRMFKELTQAGVIALSVRDKRVIYTLVARREIREALGYLDSSGLLS